MDAHAVHASTSDISSEDFSSLAADTFMKAFVASLVTKDVEFVRPHSPEDRSGFGKVVKLLDSFAEQMSEGEVAPERVWPILSIANGLREGNTGSYDGFEAALRSLQLTFTASPNPFYDDIHFPVSKTQAQSFIAHLPGSQRSLAFDAADAFISARRHLADAG